MHRAVVVAALLVASLAAPVAGQPVLSTDAPQPSPDGATTVGAATETATGAVTDADEDGQTATIDKRVELFLTPEEPGRVDVVVAYTLPDAVSSLTVRVPDRTIGIETSDFRETEDDYEWDGDGNTAQMRLTVDANRSASGSRSGALAQDGEYSFLDAGDWALVTVPQLRTGWGWSGPEDLTVDIEESTSVAGEGSTGGEVALLGDVTEHARTANGQTFTLAVPDRADTAEAPEDVLDALAAASGRMPVGDRDDRVWIGVAPADADWGVRGVEYGGNDAWVVADAELEEPSNVWLHEYVHTRQGYRTAASGRWTMEGAAEYYAAALSLELGYVDFSQFSDYLAYGGRDPWRDAVLASPETWPSGANYLKGSLVWGELDRRMRLATDRQAAMWDVLWTLNDQDGDVTNEDVVAAVRNASTGDVGDAAARFTTTDATPGVWSSDEHSTAFGVEPPRMTYDVTEFRVSGPFRNETFRELPTLYVGETLTVTATVTNDGGTRGDYEGRLSSGGETLAADSGSLSGDESRALAVQHTLSSPGTHNLSLGRDTRSVAVRSPATVRVDSLSVVPERVQTGEVVTVTAELSNPSQDPARGPVAITLDGERVGSLNATLAAGGSTTEATTLTLPESGRYEVVTVTAELSNPSQDPARGPVAITLDGERVGSLNATLAAGGSTTEATTLTLPESGRYEVGAGDQTVTVRAGETGSTVPGPGLAGAAVAVAAAALVAAAGQRRVR